MTPPDNGFQRTIGQDAILTESTEPTLIYFDLRGRAEATRLLLIDQDIPFKDERVRSAETWQKLQLELPFGALPLFKDQGLSLSQSHAILRYLAYKNGMMPDTAAELAKFDELCEAIAEYQEDLWRFAWQEAYRTKPNSYAQGPLQRQLKHLQDAFVSNPRDFWVGNAVSHIDYLAYVFTDELRAFFPDALAGFGPLKEFHDRFERRPNIAQYIKSGNRPPVFGMGLHGPKIDPDVTHNSGDTFENPWSPPIPLC